MPTQMSTAVPGRLVFLGSPLTFPNHDAVEYLLRDIWPRINSRQPSVNLQIIGRCAEPDRVRFQSFSQVTCLGYVTDIRSSVAEACCCVVPIRVGGGTRIKILDAWAMGRPVVSTSVGCEGLDAVDGENILIRDTPDSFADAVLDVVSNPELQSHLAANARKTAEESYSWNVIGRRLRAHYWSRLRSSALVGRVS
jgi:glycosyltransferase involved in cell wall biosynthesis